MVLTKCSEWARGEAESYCALGQLLRVSGSRKAATAAMKKALRLFRNLRVADTQGEVE